MKPAITAAKAQMKKTHYPKGNGFTYCGLPVEGSTLVNREAACRHCVTLFEPKKMLEIRLGAAVDLAAQLKPHGLIDAEIRVFVDDNYALNRSYIRGFLSEAEVKRARKRLFNKIEHFVKSLREKENEKVEPA